jgi:AmmeMemoRadiSam system protein B
MALFPKLRNLEFHFVTQAGQQGILVQDPLRLADRAVFVPMPLAPLLELCDGTRDEGALRASLAVRFGVQIGPSTLGQLLGQLDAALLLDNDRFTQAYARALREFRTATMRPPALAGRSYPADPEGLKARLDSFLAGSGQTDVPAGAVNGEIRGLVSPHIDYDRGGPIYAGVWKEAAAAVRMADLAIVFGTDHTGGARLTFTHQRYATPWGVIPTANGLVDQIARALGPEVAFGAELHHRTEHSVELAVVWLHYMLGETECQLVPVLCGGFEPFVEGDANPVEDPELDSALDILKDAASSERTIVVAAGDLAHVGPAFGDGYAVDIFEKARHRTADEQLMACICEGEAEGLLQMVREERDRRRICGLPAICMALRLLGDTAGRVTGYAQCPADQKGQSFVSVCGIVFD